MRPVRQRRFEVVNRRRCSEDFAQVLGLYCAVARIERDWFSWTMRHWDSWAFRARIGTDYAIVTY